jgi:redox-sensitive bicupin YhaK (pirin superfamily)
VALPASAEENDPRFDHSGHDDLPVISGNGTTIRVIAGSLFGERSPVPTASETLFADASLAPGVSLPFDPDVEERALYIVDGEIEIAGDRFGAGQLLVFRPGDRITVTAAGDARVMLLGGAAMDGPRHIWWNFVSSRKDRIEQAKADWKARRFDSVPGDDKEFIPLPEK